MRDARDADDALLLETGRHAELLAVYQQVVFQRCRLKVRGDAWQDVAQDALERLYRELTGGKSYPVHSRVVVFRVIVWTFGEPFAGRTTASSTPADWDLEDTRNDYAPLED